MMDTIELRKLIVQALAVELKVAERSVEGAKSLRNDLKMDSIAAANVAFVIEEALGVDVEIKNGDDIDSVEAIVAVARRAIGGA
jgi:acyl carrier protein